MSATHRPDGWLVGAIVALAGAGLAAGLVAVAATLVVRGRLDPVGAAGAGALALAVVEAAEVLGRRRWLPPVGPGTQLSRLAVVGGASAGALLLAVVVERHADPSPASVLLGCGAVGLLVVVVASGVGRPWTGRVLTDPGGAPPGSNAPGPPPGSEI